MQRWLTTLPDAQLHETAVLMNSASDSSASMIVHMSYTYSDHCMIPAA